MEAADGDAWWTPAHRQGECHASVVHDHAGGCGALSAISGSGRQRCPRSIHDGWKNPGPAPLALSDIALSVSMCHLKTCPAIPSLR